MKSVSLRDLGLVTANAGKQAPAPGSSSKQADKPHSQPPQKGQEPAQQTANPQALRKPVVQAEKPAQVPIAQSTPKSDGGGAPRADSAFSLEVMRDILVDMGVKASHVNIAMRRAKQTGEPLAQIMRDFGFLSGEGVAQAVSRQSGMDYFSAEEVDAINRADLEGLELHEFKRFVPVGRSKDGFLRVAVPDITNVNEALNYFHRHKTQVVVASEHTIQTVYRKHFANTEAAFDRAVQEFTNAQKQSRRREEDERSIGLVRTVYFAMLRHACYVGASDLYLYRSEFVGIVRVKVNGVGQIFRTIDLELYDRILNKMVSDNAKADDLRARPREAIVEFSDEDRTQYPDLANRFNFRLELTESRAIRSAVIRILDRNSAATDLDRLGFDSETLKAIQRISRTSTGFFLVTGPTGSGKTTSLYAILKSIDAVERSVQSIENPIEYEHGLWLQFEPRRDNTDEGEAYNEWLKALLRNAPDVILVGEVRDRSVANICLSAANTGHLVFATLHTNDAVMAIARLKSLQIDLDVLGSVLLGVLAQRLLRLLCKDCKVPDDSSDTQSTLEAPYLGSKVRSAFKAGAGCANCEHTGYRGRRMIYELLQMTPGVREALEQGEAPSVIAARGMPEERTMWGSGLRLVCDGITSLEELLRVASPPAKVESKK